MMGNFEVGMGNGKVAQGAGRKPSGLRPQAEAMGKNRDFRVAILLASW